MYSSSSSFNPFQYTTITSSFTDTQNPNPICQFPSPFMQFPPPFLDDNGDLLLNEFLVQHQYQQHQILAAQTNQEMDPAVSRNPSRINNKKKKDTKMNDTKQRVPRKRSGKKDRHSKIYTAQGPRDRRMRLSLQIARKFFDLQDMLGFDKASKTIDWLFTKSKAAIKELTDNLTETKRSDSGGDKSVSSTSESEVMSDIKLTSDKNGSRRSLGAEDDSFLTTSKQKRSKKSSDNKPILKYVSRESRDKARARARERAKEKEKIKDLDKSKTSSQPNPNSLEPLVPDCTVENGENLGFESQEIKSSPLKIFGGEEKQEKDEDDEEAAGTSLPPHQMDSISIDEKFLGLTSVTKSSSFFDLFTHQNIVVPSGSDIEDEFSGFPGIWDCSIGRIHNRYSAISNIKLSTAGNVPLLNPNAIFMSNPNSPKQKSSSNFVAQDQNFSSAFMANLEPHLQNPSSLYMNFSNSNLQNPTPFPITTHFTDNKFSCNPN